MVLESCKTKNNSEMLQTTILDIAIPTGRQGGQLSPKFKIFGQNQTFSSNYRKNSGRISHFRAQQGVSWARSKF